MLNDTGLEEKIKKELKNYHKIALYGTGKMARDIMPIFERLDMLERIIAVIDRDDSSMIGKIFFNYRVGKFTDIMHDIDAIVIVTTAFWKEIFERLEKLEDDYHVNIPIISIFDFEPKVVRENHKDDYQAYVEYIEKSKANRGEFVAKYILPYHRKKEDTKILAWYLPQYYQSEDNNRYYDKRYTEWTNISQVLPLYIGHEQPHIPYYGYYSLTEIENIQKQIELAKWYGIYGFCIHYYWFLEQKIMQKPLEILLKRKDLDIPFCLSWMAVWNSGSIKLIYEPESAKEDAEKFMRDILPYFKDSRYIKISKKPLLIIYPIELFEKEYIKLMIASFRKIAKENDFEDIYILASNYNDYDENELYEIGINGIVENPLSFMNNCKEFVPDGYINPYFNGTIYDLSEFVQEKKYLKEYAEKKVFHSVQVAFDDTAKKGMYGSSIYHGATPSRYKVWLKDILEKSRKRNNTEENFVFVNSWNAWSEGAYLEPDVKNGYAYLEATRNAIYEARGLNTFFVKNNANDMIALGKNPHFYILCIESMGDIIACEPIARVLRNQYENALVTWIVKRQYSEIVKYNPFIDYLIEVECLKEAVDICNIKKEEMDCIIVDCHFNGRRCSLSDYIHVNDINPQIYQQTYYNYGALLENFSLTAGMEKISLQPIFHEKKPTDIFKIAEKYVVIHCKSMDWERNWQIKKWKILALKIIEMGYKVVEIGLETVVGLEETEYIDLTGKREIQEVAQIIKRADLFIGVDSGFAHVANCFQKKSVILLGKLLNFERPMPYTGYLRENKEKFLIYPNTGTVKEITVEEVVERIKKLLF